MAADGDGKPKKRKSRKGIGGRPSKLTPELQAEVVRAIGDGLYRKDAARLVGVHPESLNKWMQTGRKATHGKHREFYLAVTKEEERVKLLACRSILRAGHGTPGTKSSRMVKGADGVERLEVTIKPARAGDWKALAWWLERKFPEEFGRRDALKVDQRTTLKAEVSAEVSEQKRAVLSDPESRLLLEQLAKRQEALAAPSKRSSGGNGTGGNGAKP